MQLLVVDVDLAHLGLDALSSLGLEGLAFLLLLDRIPLGRDTRVGNETCAGRGSALPHSSSSRANEGLTRELELSLLDSPLALEVVALLTPVGRDGDGVAVALDLDEEFRVGGRDVDPVDDFWLLDEAFELGDGEAVELALLALGDLSLLLRVLVLGWHLVVRVDDLALAVDAPSALLALQTSQISAGRAGEEREELTSTSTDGSWKRAKISAKAC